MKTPVSVRMLVKVNAAIDDFLVAAANALARGDYAARDRYCDMYDRLRIVQDYLEARCERE